MGATVVLPIGIALLLGFLCSDTNACREAEGVALLKLKHSLTDPLHQLSSWKEGTDCCMSWAGVRCHNSTGHVMGLKLYNMSLGGEINPSLTQLNHLRSIDLSVNDFGGARIPGFIGSLTNMTYLNLFNANFSGNLPHQLGNLSSLNYLDLGFNNVFYDSLAWISNLSNLRYLNMDEVNLINATDWLLEINKLTSLSVLHLSSCQINQIPISPPFFNLTSLSVIDLSYNDIFNSKFLQPWLLNMTSLTYLDLALNGLSGPIFEAFRNMTSLNYIDLRGNGLSGPISEAFRNMTSLTYLDLSGNILSGPIPEALGNMTSLTYLNLNINQLGGDIPISMGNLCSLQVLDLSNNKFIGEMARLVDGLSQCYPNPAPNPFDFGQGMSQLSELHLSGNLFSGSIPHSICDMLFLEFLDLSYNRLSGEFPRCWNGSINVIVLNVGHNMLSGHIPESIGSMSSLESLYLNNNSLTGEIPLCLKNCTSLVTLDLGENNLWGNIPLWLGESLLQLKLLRLRSNMFRGRIPTELSLLTSLQLLDIANNSLSGSIPPSLGNMIGMYKNDQISDNYSIDEFILHWDADHHHIQSICEDNMVVYIEGKDLQYNTTLALVKSIDLSSNKLSGEIPQELTNLSGLIFLNLAHNMLTGRIPKGIGNLGMLLMLDLSINELTGMIPQGISTLMSLNHLNLSYNNLSGRIPSGSQLQVLNDPYIYIGNEYLCGSPLTITCTYDKSPSMEIGGSDKDTFDAIWFYSGIGPGFAGGVLGLWGVLVFKTSWRFSLFRLIDGIYDWLYVTIALSVVKVRRSAIIFCATRRSVT